ncbi:HD domain-containing phosphohydrolase [Deinococcus sonorensis]|uniref:HD domain-containing phosphohydrolase n=2 Tax=Deinococcus sonorensis TaxID=309891 RepID=A0AAU7UEF1_9DEIO
MSQQEEGAGAGLASRPAASKEAGLVLDLTRQALKAATLPEAVAPTLQTLVELTSAVGAAYFQLDSGSLRYYARVASGQMPDNDRMQAISVHGLPSETPLLQALSGTSGPIYIPDTTLVPEAAGFPELGVCSVAAAPVRTQGGLLVGAYLMHTFQPHEWQPHEIELFGLVASTLATVTARMLAEEQLWAAQEASVRALGLALELRDDETKGHTDRVTQLALEIGAALGLSPEQRQALRWGASLHDIGKLAVPDQVLLKSGPLDALEWQLMQQHVQAGERFARALPFLPEEARAVIVSHHERWDGSGYPVGLSGEQIPLLARVFAVCDVYDALTSERPYKTAWSAEEALQEVVRQAGQHFDPQVVAAFLKVMDQHLQIQRGA